MPHAPSNQPGDLVVDALTVWLSDNPAASQDAPDLVALAQKLARELEDADGKDVATLAREYRMVLKDLHSLTGGDDGGDELGVAMRTAVVDP